MSFFFTCLSISVQQNNISSCIFPTFPSLYSPHRPPVFLSSLLLRLLFASLLAAAENPAILCRRLFFLLFGFAVRPSVRRSFSSSSSSISSTSFSPSSLHFWGLLFGRTYSTVYHNVQPKPPSPFGEGQVLSIAKAPPPPFFSRRWCCVSLAGLTAQPTSLPFLRYCWEIKGVLVIYSFSLMWLESFSRRSTILIHFFVPPSDRATLPGGVPQPP